MIRLTWRQFRTQATVVSGILAAVTVLLAATGPQLVHLYDISIVPCAARGDCSDAANALASRFHLLQGLGTVLVVVPAVIGVFWGAPLVARELETGTYELAWTQSVPRWRWLAVKLGLAGLASVAVAGLLSLMLTWWSSPIDRVNADPFSVFDQRGIVPLGYAAFAFALGVAAGLLLRRTLAAMAVTLVVFAAVRVAVTRWVRPNLLAPLRLVSAVQPPGSGSFASLAPPQPADWVLSDQVINAAGRVIGQNGAISLGGGRYGFVFGRTVAGGRMTLQGVGPCPTGSPRWVPADSRAPRSTGPPGSVSPGWTSGRC